MIKYFWLKNLQTIGKRENGFYIYNNQKRIWEPDAHHYISDSLFGYDPTEEAGSPYGIGDMNITRTFTGYNDYKEKYKGKLDAIKKNAVFIKCSEITEA